MTEYQTPVTLPGIRRRYAEIAPNSVTAGTPEPTLPLARWLTFAATRSFTRMVNPDVPFGPGEVNALCAQFGMLRLLAEMTGDGLADADRLAADILGHWEDGGSMGEWLWAHGQSLGIDADEIGALANAEAGIEAAAGGTQPSAALELARVRAELAELTRNHDQLVEEILRNADEDIHGADEAPEYLAERYVRWLEAEHDRRLQEALAPAREALTAIALGTAADPSVTADKALAAMTTGLTAGPGTEPAPGIPVRLVQLYLCDPCLDGEGEECHTPGCSLWMHPASGHPVRESQGVTILGTLRDGAGR